MTLSHKDLHPSPGRLEAVDALRGFALLAIVLIHNLEHYNCMHCSTTATFSCFMRSAVLRLYRPRRGATARFCVWHHF